MPITLHGVFDTLKSTYRLRLYAGAKGLADVVSWMHIMEEPENASFLRGSELVLTTGMNMPAENGEQWLLSFIKQLDESHACGLIVNVGHHISVIPQSAIRYCNEIKFPLLTMPWEMRHVDIIRDCCGQIFQGEQLEESISKKFHLAILSPERTEEYLPYLESRGYPADDQYTAITISEERSGFSDDETALRFGIVLSNQLNRHKIRYHMFQHDTLYIIVLCGGTGSRSVDLVQQTVQHICASKFPDCRMRLGVGPTLWGLAELSNSYSRSLKALRFSQKFDSDSTDFGAMGIYRILLSCDDTSLLREEVNSALGALIEYDRQHGTNNLEILKLYIESNFSLQEVAAKTYMHRNTINYRIRKIKEILGVDMETMEEKLRYLMTFYILNIL